MKRNRIVTVLKNRLAPPLAASIDNRHPSRIIVRDTSDTSDGSRHGRWLCQVFRAVPVQDATEWQNPERILELGSEMPWIVAFDDEVERTGFKDEIDLSDWILLRVERRKLERERRFAEAISARTLLRNSPQ